MKIQCDCCDKNKAVVMCCADEAVLCTDCDTRVHAANKLANKHQRVHLMSASDAAPRCDICQEKSGFFFCLEDRALLCRECDVLIHTANSLSSNHKRFLVPGIRVALEATIACQDPAELLPEVEAAAPVHTPASSRRRSTITTTADHTRSPANATNTANPATTFSRSPLQASPSQMSTPAARLQAGAATSVAAGVPKSAGGMTALPIINNIVHQTVSEVWKKSNITEFLTKAVPGWRVDELLSLAENLGDGFNTAAHDHIGSSPKAEYASNSTGNLNWTVDLRYFDEQVEDVSSHRKVPQIPSPGPTTSGLFCSTRILGSSVKGLTRQEAAGTGSHDLPDFGNAFVVPDVDLKYYSVPAATSRLLAKRNRTQYDM